MKCNVSRAARCALLATVVGGCAHVPVHQAASTAADTIYLNGDILTMAGDAPAYVDALAVSDGKILAAGSRAQVLAFAAPATTTVDLAGKTLLPGFIDGHGHVGNAIEFQRYRFLRTPDIKSVADILAALKAHAIKTGVKPGEWIVGNGYDSNLLAEKRHPTADELDLVSTDNPVLLIHASGHLGVANHRALERGAYTAASADPEGGAIGRIKGTTTPNGLLEENAFFHLQETIPGLTPEQMVTFTRLGMEEVASVGLTTVTEAGFKNSQLPLLMDAARRGALPVDVVTYAADTFAEQLRKIAIAPEKLTIQEVIGGPPVTGWAETAMRTAAEYTNGYRNRLRIAGLKLWSDGSPLGGTGYLLEPYSSKFPGKPADYRGMPTATDEQLTAFVDRWYPTRYQILIHANGDAAAEQFILAIAAAEAKHGKSDKRPVVIHCGLCTDDQIARMRDLGIIPSFYSSMVSEAADLYAVNIGEARASRMQPAGSAAKLGMIFTIHNDAPLVPWAIVPLIDAAVNRKLHHDGRVFGPEQRITTYQALLAVTRYGAYQIFEEGTKGTLEAGKLADLVVLDRNPLKIAPTELRSVQVVETVKDGKTIYRRDPAKHPNLTPSHTFGAWSEALHRD